MPKVSKTISLQYLNYCNISRKTWRMSLIFCLQVNVKDFFKLLLSFKVCVWPGMPKLPKITSLLFLCNILRKNWVMKLIFCSQISMKACYKLIVWFSWGWSNIPKVPKIDSLQFLYNIILKVEVEFLHANKHENFLKVYFNTLGIKVFCKVDIIIINGHDQPFSNYSK